MATDTDMSKEVMKTNHLDELIRNKAINAYKKEVEQGLTNFIRTLNITTYTGSSLCKFDKTSNQNELGINEALRIIVNKAISSNSKSVGDKAIELFLNNFETLKNQVEDLESRIE